MSGFSGRGRATLRFWITGLALALAVLNVYFRDTQHFLSIFMQLWFYASPIVYPAHLVSDNVAGWAWTLYQANPFYRFAEAYRNLFYDLRWPDLSTLAILLAWTAASLVVGWWTFGKFEGRLAEEL